MVSRPNPLVTNAHLVARLWHVRVLVCFQRDSDIVENSQDAMRLHVIFSEMAACKDDSQQRSWALHEDEAVITEYLQELISILVRPAQYSLLHSSSQGVFARTFRFPLLTKRSCDKQLC